MRTLAKHVLAFFFILTPAFAAGCDTSEATSAVVDNAFPAPADGGDPASQTVVYKVWWSVTLFADPVAAGASSDPNRIVPGSDVAYALLAPNWDPESGTAPMSLIAVKTKAAISASRGDTIHITLGEDTILGHCKAGSPLSQDDADFITTRIFPGDFANVVYDAATCTTRPMTEGGGDASTPLDGGSNEDATRDAERMDGARDAQRD